jgi:hypothetical protein
VYTQDHYQLRERGVTVGSKLLSLWVLIPVFLHLRVLVVSSWDIMSAMEIWMKEKREVV